MSERYESTKKYLLSLEKSLMLGWLNFYNNHSNSISDKLALIHPDHYEEIDLDDHLANGAAQKKMQGNRSFPILKTPEKCQSNLLWNYNCHLDGAIEQDHLFPYSLGGPTIPRNKIFLCRYHNMVKSSDIHCFPWEATDQWITPWIDSQIEQMHRTIFSIYS